MGANCCIFCFRVSPEISPKWYKFDDGEVAECKMDDDEVLLRDQFFVCNLSIKLQAFYHRCYPLNGYTTHCRFSCR